MPRMTENRVVHVTTEIVKIAKKTNILYCIQNLINLLFLLVYLFIIWVVVRVVDLIKDN